MELANKLSKKITLWCHQKSYMDDTQNIIVQYGIELFMETSLKLMLLLGIGILINRGLETIIILISFCSLRFFAGGFHMKTNIGCTLFMLIFWGISLCAKEWFKLSPWMYILLSSITVIQIFLFSPSKFSKYCVMDEMARIKKKIFSVIVFIVFFISSQFIEDSWKLLIVIPMFIESLTILPLQMVKFKRREM